MVCVRSIEKSSPLRSGGELHGGPSDTESRCKEDQSEIMVTDCGSGGVPECRLSNNLDGLSQ